MDKPWIAVINERNDRVLYVGTSAVAAAVALVPGTRFALGKNLFDAVSRVSAAASRWRTTLENING